MTRRAGSGSGWGGKKVSNIFSIVAMSGTSLLGVGVTIFVIGAEGPTVGVAVATSAPSSAVNINIPP
jgi:hypothetical protein